MLFQLVSFGKRTINLSFMVNKLEEHGLAAKNVVIKIKI